MELTSRELEVVALVARGLTNRDIAQALYLSHWTVKRHIARVLKKLGMATRVELAVWYDRHHSAQETPAI